MVVSSVSTAQSLGDTLRDKTSAQVVQEVKSTLQQLSVPPQTIARFIGNRAYTNAQIDLPTTAQSRRATVMIFQG